MLALSMSFFRFSNQFLSLFSQLFNMITVSRCLLSVRFVVFSESIQWSEALLLSPMRKLFWLGQPESLNEQVQTVGHPYKVTWFSFLARVPSQRIYHTRALKTKLPRFISQKIPHCLSYHMKLLSLLRIICSLPLRKALYVVQQQIQHWDPICFEVSATSNLPCQIEGITRPLHEI